MLLAEVNPTHRGHFLEDVMDDVVRQFIVDYATCQPKGPFPKDPSQGNRSCSESYYTTVTISRAGCLRSDRNPRAHWRYELRSLPGFN